MFTKEICFPCQFKAFYWYSSDDYPDIGNILKKTPILLGVVNILATI
jgi:hypothetical protein